MHKEINITRDQLVEAVRFSIEDAHLDGTDAALLSLLSTLRCALNRDDVVGVIEAACSRSLVTSEHTRRLVAVGDSTDAIMVGTFWDSETSCGCPLTQADLLNVMDAEFAVREFNEHPLDRFWSAFDALMRSKFSLNASQRIHVTLV